MPSKVSRKFSLITGHAKLKTRRWIEPVWGAPAASKSCPPSSMPAPSGRVSCCSLINRLNLGMTKILLPISYQSHHYSSFQADQQIIIQESAFYFYSLVT